MVKYFTFFSLLTHRERRRAIVANSSVTPCTAVKQVPTSPYTVLSPPPSFRFPCCCPFNLRWHYMDTRFSACYLLLLIIHMSKRQGIAAGIWRRRKRRGRGRTDIIPPAHWFPAVCWLMFQRISIVCCSSSAAPLIKRMIWRTHSGSYLWFSQSTKKVRFPSIFPHVSSANT